MSTPRELPVDYRVRRYRQTDRDQVLALIDADALPGQPAATPEVLAEALAGRSTVDARSWARLSNVQTDVLVTNGHHNGQILGVVSYARCGEDLAGVVLWLHAQEQAGAVGALVDHALDQLQMCRQIFAFDLATAFTPTLGALPIRHRAVTAAALRSTGFNGRHLWNYFHRPMPPDEVVPLSLIAGLDLTHHRGPGPATSTFLARQAAATVGQVTVTDPINGVSELWWWLNARDTSRAMGAGRALLRAALTWLQAAGVGEIVTRIRDRPSDNPECWMPYHLLYGAGLRYVDELMCFSRVREPAPAREPAAGCISRRGYERLSSVLTEDDEVETIPLARMLSVVDTDHGPAYIVTPDASGLQLSPEAYAVLCDTFEVIHKNLPQL